MHEHLWQWRSRCGLNKLFGGNVDGECLRFLFVNFEVLTSVMLNLMSVRGLRQ